VKHTPALAALVVHFLIFYIINQYLNPHPDMLDHWVWSRFLSLSYYEHPPMIAWLIRGITMVGGQSEAALEVGSQLLTLMILTLIYAGTFLLYGKNAALVTLLILCSMPYFTLGSIFLHITQPFLIFWILSLFLLIRYHSQPEKKWLLLIGVVAGFGALSKYIMLLFYIGLFLHLLLYQKIRREILNPWLYFAGILSLVIFIPVIIWNAQHDWISFRWTLEKGTTGSNFGENTLAFTIGHLILFSPMWALLGVVSIWWLRDRLKDGKQAESVITVLSMLPLLFFTLMSLKGTISDPHWANLAYIGIAIMLGNELLYRVKRKTIYIVITTGLVFNAVLIGTVLMQTLTPLIDWMPHELKNFQYLKQQGLPDKTLLKLNKIEERFFSREKYIRHLKDLLTPEEFQIHSELIQKSAMHLSADPLTRVLKWDRTGKQLQNLLVQNELRHISYVVSREYQLSSALSFYLPDRPWPHSIEKPERNLWSPIEKVKSKQSIFVCELQECQGALEDFFKRYKMNLNYLGEVETRSRKRLIRILQVYSIGH